MDDREISLKMKSFIEEYMKNGFNATKAYQKIYLMTDAAKAGAAASRLLKKPKVKEYIKNLKDIDKENLTTKNIILQESLDILKKAKEIDRYNDALRAIDIIAKLEGYYIKEESDRDVTIKFEFEELSDE